MTRVLLADDNAQVRAGLRELLKDTPDLTVAGEAATAQEALQMAETHTCDVVLLDLLMPDRNSLQIIPELRRLSPPPVVIVLTICPAEWGAELALAAGAAEYLTKNLPPEQIVAAVRRAAPHPAQA
jgi:two-component system, NarL family, invasion response regulator UvrY